MYACLSFLGHKFKPHPLPLNSDCMTNILKTFLNVPIHLPTTFSHIVKIVKGLFAVSVISHRTCDMDLETFMSQAFSAKGTN